MRNSTVLPRSYLGIIQFMFSYSGPWAILSIVLFLFLWKFFFDDWRLRDFFIILLVFSCRGVIEWALHTYLHHAKPLPLVKLRLKTKIYSMHINHHRNPDDLDALLFKGRSIVAAVVVFMAALYFTPFSYSSCVSLVIGFLVAVLVQEFAHVVCHSDIMPESDFAKKIIFLHRYHHSEDATKCMGVSSSLGDKIFKTLHELR